jgi:uncharacterized RDD family membrane protein YckC
LHPAVDVTEADDSGVYYRPADYVGFWRRFVIDLVDVAVVIALWCVLATVALAMKSPDWAARTVLYSFPVVAFAYLVLLKRSRFRTLGYKLCGARIVSLQGERPGISALTVRFLFALFGPLNLVLDLLWIPGSECRQALRDRFAQTYVVRLRAEPEGRGRVVYTLDHILCVGYLFPEVRSRHESGAP